MRFGVFTVGLPELTPEEGAAALAEAGYDGVEWRVTHVPEEVRGEAPSFWRNNRCTFEPGLDQAARAREVARAAGLAVIGLGTYLKVGDLEATESAMRFARAAGAPQLRVGVGRTDGVARYSDLARLTRDYLERVAELAGGHGVRALVEIHHRTIIPSASMAERLVRGLDPARVGVIVDAGNMAREGFEDYRFGLEILGPYVAHVHVKNSAWRRPDGGGGVWEPVWSPLDDGVVDFGALFAALKEFGYDGWVVVEDFSDARPAREAMVHDLGFLRAAAGLAPVAAGGGAR
ncbi:MAG: sugar phosphate isomerase/epimerase family protein [Kineosporiaceae bacterium]